MKLIERTDYLKRLIDIIGTPDIKVITGVRRSGKSKLLESFITYLQKELPNANIIHINFNLPEFAHLLTSQSLYDYVRESHRAGVSNFVIIDEVQMCEGFEKAINGLHATEMFDLYITGSNAFLLSSDLATLFTGRTFEIAVYPFSFREFMTYYELDDPNAAFDRYLLEGGMAGSYLYRAPEAKYDYIADIFNTLIIRDIRQKYKIRNTPLLDRVTDYLIDNISNLSSARNIANALTTQTEATNHKTISSYISYLCDAFAFYRIRRYDIRGKKYLASNDKYYLSDHSFRYAKLGTKNMDFGRTIENIVAIELLRRGYEVYVGMLYKKEIDFVAIKRDEKFYIQVSENISDPDTLEREVTPLLQIKDAYPKLLLTRSHHLPTDYEGIQIIDVAEWLLQK
ncbi:MAG: ATP-binding protein [Clostridia bacterium]|nr:ATP-binding protein [Clostridia bacterium]